MSIIFKVWTVHRSNDALNRHNGPTTDVCSSKEYAEVVAHRSGCYGGNAPISERWAIKVNEDVYLLESMNPVDLDNKVAKEKKELRKSVISRLSIEELEALGIKDEE